MGMPVAQQALHKGQPVQVGRAVAALAAGGAGHRRQQADALVVAQGVGTQAGAGNHLRDGEKRVHGRHSGSWSALQVKRFVPSAAAP
jgi:hypothetical protein